jgi:phosphatidylglycerophosphatase A
MKKVMAFIILICFSLGIFVSAASTVSHEFYIKELDNSTDISDEVVGEVSNGIWISLLVLLVVAFITLIIFLCKRKRKIKKVRRKRHKK